MIQCISKREWDRHYDPCFWCDSGVCVLCFMYDDIPEILMCCLNDVWYVWGSFKT